MFNYLYVFIYIFIKIYKYLYILLILPYSNSKDDKETPYAQTPRQAAAACDEGGSNDNFTGMAWGMS